MPTQKQSPTVPNQATVTPIRRPASGSSARPIVGMKAGWYYDPTIRRILHSASKESRPLPVGPGVPVVCGRVTYRMSNRSHTRIGWLLESPEGQRRIASAHDIEVGTWADMLGVPRPVGPDQRLAFAQILSEDVASAPEVAGIAVKTPEGDLVLPEAESQDIGYLRLGDPDEAAAMKAWRRILSLAAASPRTTLVISAVAAGPLISSLSGIPGHVLNHQGGGQQGKSLVQQVQASMLGDPTDSARLFAEMSTTANALPDLLLLARYLPLVREEASAGGFTVQQLRALLSRIIGGGRRDRLSAEGAVRFQVGAWRSVLSLSSNETLHIPGQPESWASRVIEVHSPFWPGAAEGQEAAALAVQYHGWPLHWAVQTGQFTAARIAEWRELHQELTASLAPADGGIPLTLTRIVAAWVVGAHLLAQVLGMPELGERAMEDARELLPQIIDTAVETNTSPGALLWENLSGLVATQPLCWPDFRRLGPQVRGPEDHEPVLHTMLGYWYDDPKRGLEVHVLKSTMDGLAKSAGIDSTTPGLAEMRKHGILRSTQGATKFTSKPPSGTLRQQVPGMVYIINVDKAQAAYNEANAPTVLPALAVPADDSAVVRAEQAAMERAALPLPSTAEQAAGVVREAGPVVEVPTMPEALEPEPVRELVRELVFPRPVPAAEVDKAWAELVRAGGRTASTAALGALDAAGLHLPNHKLVELERLPLDVDETYALMEAYGLRTLYLHLSAAEAMGLPAYDVSEHNGPMKPTPHPWATPAEGGPVAEVQPGGVSSWMTLVPADGTPRRHIAVPGFDSRFDKGSGRGGFGGAPDGAVLLDAVMLFTLSTARGRRPQPIGYYRSPNRTAEAYAGGREREGITSDAVRQGRIPILAQSPRLKPMVNGGWSRPLLDAERGAGWIHQFDKTAAWLAAFGSTPLGVGEPEHLPHGGIAIDRRFAGIWRVAEIPDLSELWYLPELRPVQAPEGGWWLRSTPAAAVLMDAYPDWTPQVLEAWIWPNSSRVLESTFYSAVHKGREFLLAQEAAGRPGAAFAKRVNGALYKSFRGYLERSLDLVQRDRTTGEIYARDIWWRPDWAQALQDAAMGNTWRNIAKFTATGHYPIALQVDAVLYVSEFADPADAKPGEMELGTRGGQWTVEGSAPLAELLPALDRPGARPYGVMWQYLNGKIGG